MKKSMHLNESIPERITHVKENRTTGEKNNKSFVDTMIMLDLFISLCNEESLRSLKRLKIFNNYLHKLDFDYL